jgi:DNA-binding CsgD family transcriptional regulator
MELPFAVLHQLCAPMLDSLERLPDPQREALSIVFGRSAGPRPDRLMVGLAVLSLMSEAAADRPLLCVVDDLHWLDKETAQTLSLVARRLRADAVGLLFGTRGIDDEFDELPHIEVLGLPNGDARALLGSVVRFMLDDRVRDRIVAETAGNPLALLELPRGLTASQLAGGFGLTGPHALPGMIERSFARQAESLSSETRSLLLIAAADPVGDPMLVWRAAEKAGIEVSGPAASDMEDLLVIDARVRFRHPLVRSAVYRSASSPERRAAHLALAEVTDREVDPDRRAWHLAIAASGPDEYVATELEHAARRAQDRGGWAAHAAFMRRSVALTRDPIRRSERALAGAYASMYTGAFEVALTLLATADAGPLDEFGRVRVRLLRAEAMYGLNRGNDATSQLLDAAEAMEPLDPPLARDAYLNAWSSALFAGRLAVTGDLRDVSLVVRAAGPAVEPVRPSDRLLDGLALLITEGRDAARPLLEQAVTAFAGTDVPTYEVVRKGWLATVAAAVVWDWDACMAAATRQVELARAEGALSVLALGLNTLCQVSAWAGDFDQAGLLMTEARTVTEATGTHLAPYGALVLSALRGREDETFELIDATVERAALRGQGIALQYGQWARSVIFNALGRYEQALAESEQASDDTPQLYLAAWALSERIEAASRCGRTASAAEALERLLEQTRGAESGWALGVQARARALLSEGGSAEFWYREAIAQLSRGGPRPELARAHLLYGEWLRREGRRVDARIQLRTAHHLLTAIGMEAFAERARRELLGTGEIVRKRSVETADELTQQERQIALLAGGGLSNPEVGARLFISPRTVEWHLRKVFAKLDIGSRKELGTALRAVEPDRGG